MNPPQRVRLYGLEKHRLEALADGIFAVSLERHFVIYVFIVIGMHWINHRIQFHFVRCTDRRLR